VVRPTDDLRPIPDDLADEVGTFATLAGVVMNGLRRAGLTWGESLAVFGLGLVGQLAVRVALAAGAIRLFAIEPSETRRRRLPCSPRILTLDGDDRQRLPGWVESNNRGRKVDLAVEATGAPGLIPTEAGVVRDLGRLLLLGSPSGATAFDFHDLCNRPSLTIVGAHGFSQPWVETPDNPWTGPRHGELFFDWVRAGVVSTDDLVTHTFPFTEAPAAYRLLSERRGEALGVLFDWT
jgi:threonine dehydrogenase-like Zn-dependent dehydrogenase